MSGIYQIRNLINGKVYIGSAVNINDRWSLHKHQLNKGNHHSKHLQNAWTKYGKENFVFEILEEIKIEELLEREQFYLDNKTPWDIKIGYNINKSSKTRLGMKHTEESKEKNRQSQLGEKGYWYGRGQDCWTFGKSKSAETKVKMSDKNKEFYQNKENKILHSERMKLWWAEKRKNNN